jgi:hypothetical protein
MNTLDVDSPEGQTLESLVDKHGLLRVLETLGDICETKADRIQASYATSNAKDPLAWCWREAGKQMYHTSGLKAVEAVS